MVPKSAESYMESVNFELFYTWVSKRSVVEPTLQYKERKVDVFSLNFKLKKSCTILKRAHKKLVRKNSACFKKRKLSNEICD